jgi:hypothetical protein
MSNALAIAGVTATLRSLLDDGFIVANLSSVLSSRITVSVVPPDRVIPANGSEVTQLNLFLHQVTPNPGWRNEFLPSRDSAGRSRLTNPPLALDLHYLLSVYSSADLHGEILLGYAMQILHEKPVLTRADIRAALTETPTAPNLPPELISIARCGLADQVEQITITSVSLSTEEMSKLWSAMQAHYRPSVSYLVTVVLIESNLPARSALPVLTRGRRDTVTGREPGVFVQPNLIPPVPTIEKIAPEHGESVVRLGDMVDIIGHHLNGMNRAVTLSNARFGVKSEISAESDDSYGLLQFRVPNAPPDFPVGVYLIAALMLRPGEDAPRTSNSLSLVIAPEIVTPFPITVVRVAGDATIDLQCTPHVQPGQRVSLLLADHEIPADPFDAATDFLTFVYKAAPAGEFLARLRVDGVDSRIVDRETTPPVFLNRKVTIQ